MPLKYEENLAVPRGFGFDAQIIEISGGLAASPEYARPTPPKYQGTCKVGKNHEDAQLPHPLTPSPLTWRGGITASGLPSPQRGEGLGVGLTDFARALDRNIGKAAKYWVGLNCAIKIISKVKLATAACEASKE